MLISEILELRLEERSEARNRQEEDDNQALIHGNNT
jgi:hypothetical protein